MSTAAQAQLESSRAIVGSCLILSIPSASLSPTLNAGLVLGLSSVVIRILLGPLRIHTSGGLVWLSMLTVTAATMLGILFGALWPSKQWDVSTFSLLVAFNVVLLAWSPNGIGMQRVSLQLRQALLTSALFLVALTVLLLLKAAFGNALEEFSGSLPKPLHMPWLLYPGGIVLVAGLLYALFAQKGIDP